MYFGEIKNNKESNKNLSQPEFNQTMLINLITKLLSPQVKERSEAENLLQKYYYEPNLYKNLIENGLYNKKLSDNELLQIFIILKKLLKDIILAAKPYSTTPIKVKINQDDKSAEKTEEIINILKLYLLSYLNQGDFSQNYNKIIKDIVCIISNKYFPYKWDKLKSYYIEFFEFDPSNVLSVKYFQVAEFISNMFYTTMKNFDYKNKYNSNFEEFKNSFTKSFMNYYNTIKDLFTKHPNGIINDEINQKCFKIMTKNDKILILLIRFNFSINNFHKDNNIIKLVDILLVRIKDLLMMFERLKVKNYKNILEQNIFKIFKHIVLIIQKDPIIFCYHIDQLINLLSAMLKNCNLFQRDTTKVILFNLAKILSTSIYRENIQVTIEE